MPRTVTLQPDAAMWLLSRADHDALFANDPDAVPHPRYRWVSSAQLIYYEPTSVAQEMRLAAAFEQAQAPSAPTVEQARAIYDEIADEIPLFAFERDGDLWHIRNQSAPSYGDPLVERDWVLVVGREGEAGFERAPLAGAEVARALSWLPLLDGHHTLDEVAAAVRGSAAAVRVFRCLSRAELFAVDETAGFDRAALPELLFVSHSCLFVRGERASVIFDPAILSSTEALASAGRRPYALIGQADAVFVTHNHWDHLSCETMLRIPRQTPIYVPRLSEPSLANPPMRVVLEAFGFTNVREAAPWDEVTVGDIDVLIVPFFGEPFGVGSRFDGFTYHVEVSGHALYGTVDAWRDEAGDMDPVIEALRQRKRVDTLLFGASNMHHEPLYSAAHLRHYSNELVARPDLVRFHPCVDDVARWSRVLEPQRLIPYAEFIFSGARDCDDLRAATLSARGNLAAYWQHFAGEDGGVPEYLRAFKGDIDRLASEVPAQLVALHPLQGLWL
ncbi:MAG: MBL fold metallo-hydrolase [Myxococcales bacterium]|nr:MBL fold metallo-hydrolase [Myxococcales bacterium]